MAFFSVVIPVYNAKPWLLECLNSVAKQSFTDFEIMLTDDGSNDGSGEILEEYKEAHPELQVTIIHQENAGLGNARNEAAKQSKGTWLCFLDADDYWSVHKLKQCYNFIRVHSKIKWFYHEVYEKYPNGRMREREGFICTSISQLLLEGNPIVPSATIISKSFFDELNGFDEQRDRVEDLGTWIRAFSKGEFPGFLEETSTVYRLGSGLTQNEDAHFKKVMTVISEAENEGWVTSAESEGFLKRKTYEFARQAHKMGDFKRAIKKYQEGSKSWKVGVLKTLAQLRIAV